MSEIISFNKLERKIKSLRSKKKKIVATNGCFDILHIGHIRSLKKAKSLGDILIVGVNSDSSVKKIKGKNRPINKESERAEVLAAVSYVDFVTIFREKTAHKFLKKVKPDIYVKGKEYNQDNLPEAELIKKFGGRVVFIPMVKGSSTTITVKRLKKN